nr:hypothetical protein L204_04238 [Cryptococcus depauperatus CBS 7855]
MLFNSQASTPSTDMSSLQIGSSNGSHGLTQHGSSHSHLPALKSPYPITICYPYKRVESLTDLQQILSKVSRIERANNIDICRQSSSSPGGLFSASCPSQIKPDPRSSKTTRLQTVSTLYDVLVNIRQGIDLSEAVHSRLYRPKKATAISSATGTPSQSRSSSSSTGVKAGVKRPFSETSLPLPPSKHSISTSQIKASIEMLSNRVHRRVILCDYGKPIYKATSRVALLAAMERCIAGHESLLQAGFLHRDISINNLMIDEDNDNAFLIDLDHAIRVPRISASGAEGKIGTRAFMAIGAHLGDEHSFMHDLESFFWVLFWICTHYDGPGKAVSAAEYDEWKCKDDDMLADLKFATIGDERMFLDTTRAQFTPFYKPLIPLMNEIRKKVFPNDQWWETEDMELYSLIKEILANGQKDPEILGVPIS